MPEDLEKEAAPKKEEQPEPYCKGDCANCPHPCNF